MSLGTINSVPPPFFKQGPSAFSRLVFFSALALLFMIADFRLGLTGPIRQSISVLTAPIEWLVNWPIDRIRGASRNVQDLKEAQDQRDVALSQLRVSTLKAQQSDLLALENQKLRSLLDLKHHTLVNSIAAELVHESRDPFSRKFTLNKGSSQGVQAGMPVIDEKGVIGQVTRVYLLSSEVSAITDKDMALPVQNLRTGMRSIAYGDAAVAGALELRFMPANADVKESDQLITSGLDGVYPPGLSVARVIQVERRAESTFARIVCEPVSGLNSGRQVLLLHSAQPSMPPSPGSLTQDVSPRESGSSKKHKSGKPSAANSAKNNASPAEGDVVGQ